MQNCYDEAMTEDVGTYTQQREQPALWRHVSAQQQLFIAEVKHSEWKVIWLADQHCIAATIIPLSLSITPSPAINTMHLRLYAHFVKLHNSVSYRQNRPNPKCRQKLKLRVNCKKNIPTTIQARFLQIKLTFFIFKNMLRAYMNRMAEFHLLF